MYKGPGGRGRAPGGGAKADLGGGEPGDHGARQAPQLGRDKGPVFSQSLTQSGGPSAGSCVLCLETKSTCDSYNNAIIPGWWGFIVGQLL